MLAAAASLKTRTLVATGTAGNGLADALDGRAQVRSMRMEILAHFAPLLAGLLLATGLILATLLLPVEPPLLLGGWLMMIVAACWLGVRRLQTDALAYLRRDVPRHVAVRSGLLLLLMAAIWVALPAALYAQQSPPLRTVAVASICTLMCASLAIAAAPAVALCWAAVLAAGLALGVVMAHDSVWMPLALTGGIGFGFLALVIRRIGAIIRAQAELIAKREAENVAANRLMREYEERGTSCLWQTDRDHLLTYVTPGFAVLVGRPASQLMGVALPAVIGGDGALGAALLARAAFSGIEVELGEGPERRAIAFSGTPITSKAGDYAGFRGSCTDVTETRSSERRLRQLASLDVLTELPNRMRMRELLGEALLAARASGRPCGILMLDLDGFKPVNDTFGHPKGDAVLKTVAERLVATVGDKGIVGRLGGDEFAIVLHDTQNRRLVADLADRLIAHVSEPYVLDGVSLRIGLSIGSAFGPLDGDTVDELVKHGDLALYDAKASGRGAYRHFELSMQTEAENRIKLEYDLRQALALDQFRLYYQPLIHSQSQEVTGFEALIRWQHPVRGFVSPADFVPLAEELGLIHELGEWIVRTAIRDCAKWPAPITVAVNLSPLQLQSSHVPALISDALARFKLPANRLELEVTESVFMGDSDGTLDVLRRLRALGVRIALDDFGTGYSSLGYLNRTIFNKLKIDGSFVRGAGSRPETVSIIQAIVTLANCFQMTITAEGIETLEDYRRMADLGCHQMQGYLFGRPVPFDRATELVGTQWGEARRLASA